MPLMIPDVRCQLDESPLSSKPHNIIGISKTKEENNKREAIKQAVFLSSVITINAAH